MDLLTNAIESIKLGVQDYRAGDQPRLLSAVRNIHAGILLLYKEALRRLSPDGSGEVLVKANVAPKRAPDGSVIFVGAGERTVDIQQIKKHFNGLGIATDWSRFDRISIVRNKVEHYYPHMDQQALRGVIANVFIIVRSFIANQLEHDPRELLGETAWKTMLEIADVYAEDQAECQQQLESVDWASETLAEGVVELTCNQCGSDLLRPQSAAVPYNKVQLECHSCGAAEEGISFIPRAVATARAFDLYLVHDDGADTPYVSCPECIENAYVMDEQRCALCGHEAEHRCARCAHTIPAEELDVSPLCGWCAHMMSKDD